MDVCVLVLCGHVNEILYVIVSVELRFCARVWSSINDCVTVCVCVCV